MTIHRTSTVRVLGKFQRRTREEVGQTAVVLADPFMQEGVMVCPLGFFSHTHGAWVRVYPLADLDEVGDITQDVVAGTIPRSYRPEYRIWAAMRRRCTAMRDPNFYLYGGRVTVCPEWEQSFDTFMADMGPRPSPKHSLDRIDNNGNYEPKNVRWATPTEQARNTSRTRFVTALGQTKPLTQWAEELGISPTSLEYRLREWDADTACSRPESKSSPLKPSFESRRKRGAGHHLAKLDDAKVVEIRLAFKTGNVSVATLAEQHNVTYGTIYSIVRNKTWKHVQIEG